MATSTVAALPRVSALMVLAAVSTATVALLAGTPDALPMSAPAPAQQRQVDAPLVVPDVRGQAHVFAKVVLEEAGFAWRVQGSVRGFSANAVVRQIPEPGTRVHDTGQPMIALELARTPAGDEHGRPENRAAYRGTRIRLYDVPSVPFASPDRPEGRL